MKKNIYTSIVTITDETGNVIGDIEGKDGLIKIRNLDLSGHNLLSSNSVGVTGQAGLQGDRYNTLSQALLISPVNGGSLTFTVDTNLSYLQSNLINITNVNNVNSSFKANVLSYDKTTGILVCNNIRDINGSFSGTNIYNINIYTSNESQILSSLLNMPPAPEVIELTTYYTSTEIGFAIKNPTRIPFGNILIPYIDKIRVTLGSNNNVSILDNSVNIPSSNLDIRGIILSKIGSSRRDNKPFAGQGSIPAYVYSNPDMSQYLEEGKYKVNIWFNNTLNNGTPNVLTVTLNDFIQSFPPTSPLNLSVDYITKNTSALSWEIPLYTSGSNNEAGILDYKIDYINTGTPNRYHPSNGNYTVGTQLSVTSETTYKTLTSLFPGTNYNVNVSAKNNVHPNYGDLSTVSFLTLNPDPPPTLTNLPLILPPSMYSSNLKKVSNKEIINEPIYLYSVNAGSSVPVLNLPIHSDINPGSTGTGLMTIKSYLNDTLNHSVSFNGFGSTPYTSTISTNGFIFSSIQDVDYYTAQNETYFYKICSSVTPTLNQTNISPLDIGVPHTVKINFSRPNNENVTSNLLTFYLDDLSKPPTISTLNITDSLISKTISGIPIVGSSGLQDISYISSAMNFARNFYRADKIYSITSSVLGVNVTPNSLTILDTTEPIQIDTDFTLSGSTTISFSNNVTSLGIDLIGTIYSPYTSNGSFATKTFTIPKILDTLTFNKTTVGPNTLLSKTSFTKGYRVLTQNPLSLSPSPNNFTLEVQNYDHNFNLLTPDYIDELPILKGSYKTRASEASYLNNIKNFGGPDYSQMSTETNFRYSTFSWNVDINETTTLNKLEFKFTDFNANGLVIRDDQQSAITSGGKFVAYYRFVELDSSGNVILPQDNEDNPSVLTSYWLDANKYSSYFKGYYNKPVNNGILGGLLFTGSDVSPINNPASSDFTYNLQSHSILPKTSGKYGYKIYLMVGIKMDANISFSDVYCKYSTQT